MYRWLRNLHLAAGLFSAIFLAGYASSAAQMAYPIYHLKPSEARATMAVPADVGSSPRSLAQWLMDDRDLRGDLIDLTTTDTAITLRIVRPGTTHQVSYDRLTKTALVTTSTLNGIGMLNRLHHISGLRHEYWIINVWGGLLLVVSAALLLLSASGLVMWFERHQERKAGLVVAAAGILWGMTVLVLVRAA